MAEVDGRLFVLCTGPEHLAAAETPSSSPSRREVASQGAPRTRRTPREWARKGDASDGAAVTGTSGYYPATDHDAPRTFDPRLGGGARCVE